MNAAASTVTITDVDGTQYLFGLAGHNSVSQSPLQSITYRGGYVQTLSYDPNTSLLTG